MSFPSHFKGDVIRPHDEGYSEAIKRWSKLSERKARLVVYPKDVDDVITALQWAVETNTELVVKSSGHNMAGSSSTDRGMVIDLSRYMNSVRVDPDKRIVHVGGGAIWDQVDEACGQHGLATVGPAVNMVGVGGFVLGGGYGHLSSEHGLGVDNLVSATMVLADGSVVQVSAESHPDLFWAIRGAGGNFGICTKLSLKLHPQPSPVFAGEMIFPPPKAGVVFDTVLKWQKEVQTPKDTLNVVFAGAIVSVLHNGPIEVGKERFKMFTELGRNGYCRAATQSRLPGRFAQKVFQKFTETLTQHPEFKPSNIVFQFFHPGKLNSVTSDTSHNTRGMHGNVLINMAWEGDADLLREAKAGAEAMKADLGEYGEGAVAYGNAESDHGESDAVRRLFGDNYPRLQRLKSKYDAKCVFGGWFPIVPADHSG